MNDKKDDATISFASNATEAPIAETVQLTATIVQDSLSPESGDPSQIFDGRFKIEKELGRGGIGVTYLAIDLADGNRVAVKSLLERLNAKDTAWVERHFKDEVAALSRINHSGVVKLITSGETPDGKPYIAMEYVKGVDLRSQIEPEKGLDDFERIADIMQQLGQAISAAHDAGIYHRDLKPENVLLAKQVSSGGDLVKVIDFGIATVKNTVDEKTRATVLAGSVRYMAPEQLYGKPSAATDIYALGALSYEMITGRTPFNPDLKHPLAAMQQLIQMQKSGVRVKPQDLRPSLPDEAQEIILKALSFNIADRYQRADEFGNALAKALTAHDEEELTTSYIDKGTQVMTSGAAQPATLPEQKTSVEHGRKTNVAGVREKDKLPVIGSENSVVTGGEEKKTLPKRIIAIAAIVLVLVFAAVALLIIFKDRDKNVVPAPQPTAAKTYGLSYWTEVQRYKDNKKIGDPKRLYGGTETTFSMGDGLRFHFSSSTDGYLYVIYEDMSKKEPTYLFLYPVNNASPQVKAGADVATSENLFDEKAGTEKVWIIWSAKAIPEIQDAAARWANKENQGEIKDPSQAGAVKTFITQNQGAKNDVSVNDDKRQIEVSSKNETIVRLLPLIHENR